MHVDLKRTIFFIEIEIFQEDCWGEVRITGQILTSLMLCAVILYLSGGTYSLKSISFDEKLSWQFYLLSDFLPEICWEELVGDIFLHVSCC